MATQTRPTLQQRRAAHAWQAVEKLTKEKTEAKNEYAREAKKLPARILASGLGPALAFLHAKGTDKKPHLKALLADLSDWVLKQRPIQGKDPASLMYSVVHGDSNFLRRATDEVLAYLEWLNRFLEAEGLPTESE
ncbi:MAG: hypothetical protein KatS3mg110_3070 [Pirellulaceae bacterium]|nr:MAG: hypothetical protein KatS3mg110_3070 [Pirellulaceae bacterium]